MDTNIAEYLKCLHQLGAMRYRGQLDSDEAEEIREMAMAHWDRLSGEQKGEVEGMFDVDVANWEG